MVSSWSNFPFVRILLAFVSGLLVGCYWGGMTWVLGPSLGLFLFGYAALVVSTDPIAFHRRSPWIGLLGLSCIFLMGYMRSLTHNACRDADHLTHWAASIEAYKATALENAHEKETSSRIIVAVHQARIQGKWKQVRGKVQVIFPRPSRLKVTYGDLLLVLGQPQPVPSPSNPYEFDRANFLALSQVHHQHLVAQEKVVLLANSAPNPIKALSFRVLNYCKSLLSHRIKHKGALAVVLALVLGCKDELDPRLRDAYASTGTMHVLAVSGLHVGMLYWALSVLLALFKKNQHTRWLPPMLSLIILWFYALITGLSPSVLRATLMFTFVVFAKIIDRHSNIYNTLAASAFLLLFWDPLLIFSVSFQLSYLAVLGIVYLQPKIYHWLAFNNPFLDKLWLLASVSLAAQISTTPVSLYYFHQFPTYFLIANWLVVPAALLILCLGLGVLMTSFWAGFNALIAWVLEQLVLTINQFNFVIQQLPFNAFEKVYLNISTVLLLYASLVLVLIFLYTKRFKYLVVTTAVIVLLTLHSLQVYCNQKYQRKVIFYSINHHQVVAFVKGQQGILCVDNHFKEDAGKYNYYVQPSQMAMGIVSLMSYTLDEALQQQGLPLRSWQGIKLATWQGKSFVFVNKSVEKLPTLSKKLRVDFLVLEKNAVTTLQPLLACFDFGGVVIGASNKKPLAEQLQAEAKQIGLYNHSLLQQGALVLDW